MPPKQAEMAIRGYPWRAIVMSAKQSVKIHKYYTWSNRDKKNIMVYNIPLVCKAIKHDLMHYIST